MSDTEILARGKYLQLVKRGNWEYAHRPNVSGIVSILAVTDAGEVLLVEQYRAPLNKTVIELPAGLAGDLDESRGESLESAARRELLEETGCAATAMQQIAEGTVSSGICDEIITLFRATGLKKVQEHAGDGSENITLHVVPVSGIDTWLATQQQRGALVDLKVYAGLRFVK